MISLVRIYILGNVSVGENWAGFTGMIFKFVFCMYLEAYGSITLYLVFIIRSNCSLSRLCSNLLLIVCLRWTVPWRPSLQPTRLRQEEDESADLMGIRSPPPQSVGTPRKSSVLTEWVFLRK
jgi:hypothetical protein